VAAVNGERIARVVLETPDSSLTAAEELGQQAAQALREQGAEDILAS
jgi:hypothetical protein